VLNNAIYNSTHPLFYSTKDSSYDITCLFLTGMYSGSKTVCNGYLYIFPYITFLCHIINISSPTFLSPAAVPYIFSSILHYNYKISLSKSTHYLLPFFFHLLKTNTTNKQWKEESGTHAICSVLLFLSAA
jgi:hypothetical protein